MSFAMAVTIDLRVLGRFGRQNLDAVPSINTINMTPCQMFVLSRLPKSSIKSSTLSLANSLDRFRP